MNTFLAIMNKFFIAPEMQLRPDWKKQEFWTFNSKFCKGQLISKCPFDVFKSSKQPMKFFSRGQIKKVVYVRESK